MSAQSAIFGGDSADTDEVSHGYIWSRSLSSSELWRSGSVSPVIPVADIEPLDDVIDVLADTSSADQVALPLTGKLETTVQYNDAEVPRLNLRSKSRSPYRVLPFQFSVLETSNYLRLYNACSRQPSAGECQKALFGLPQFRRTVQKLDQMVINNGSYVELRRYVIALWVKYGTTHKGEGGVEFYVFVNKAILRDSATWLSRLMPLIRCLTDRVNYNTVAKTVVTYRGSKLSKAQYTAINLGCWYRVAMFVASSMSKRIARKFVSESYHVYIQLKIPVGCVNAAALGEENEFNEREFLLPPYTAVCITSKFNDSDGAWLAADVAEDNTEHALSLPSICI